MLDLKINIFEADEYTYDLNIYVSDTIIVYDTKISHNPGILEYINRYIQKNLIAFTGFSVVANSPPTLISKMPIKTKGNKWQLV